MSKHTQGPWHLVERKDPAIVSSWHVQIGAHELPFFPYKRVYSEDRTQSALATDHEHMANARLIAAAPELLAALTALLPMFADWHKEFPDDVGDKEGPALDAARAAIAKATGEKA